MNIPMTSDNQEWGANAPRGWQRQMTKRIASVTKGRESLPPRLMVYGPEGVGTSMTAHEFGGTYRKRHYPKRPLMGPVLNKTAAKLPKLWENAVKQ